MTRATLTVRQPVLAADTKRFSGQWVIYRKAGKGYSRTAGGGRMPRFRHPSFDAAQAEAERLAELFPESMFIILQECARTRMKPIELPSTKSPPGAGQDREGTAPALPVQATEDVE